VSATYYPTIVATNPAANKLDAIIVIEAGWPLALPHKIALSDLP
jgi:hypothetical protein